MMRDLSGQKLGNYELRERLGRGGMAEVYKAYHPSMDRFVAVKVMLGHLADDSDFVERFKREAQAVGKLRHPHIVQVFDFGVENDVYYMVMEYISGRNLKSYISTTGSLSDHNALYITSQIAAALDYAHHAGMIHRDLKPANIMFLDEEQLHVVLTDFGIARILGQAGLTASGAMVGTPAYISPEAARGEDTDERADIYGLGIILFEVLTGRVPYDADTPMAIIMKHINAPVPSLKDYHREIPDSIERIILKALTKDPNDRFQHASDMKEALDDAIAQVPKDVTRPSQRTAALADMPTLTGDTATEGATQTILEDNEPTIAQPTPMPQGKDDGATEIMSPSAKPRITRNRLLIAAALMAVLICGGLIAGILSDESDDKDADSTEVAQDVTEASVSTETVEPAPSTEPVSTVAPPTEVADAPPPEETGFTQLTGLSPIQDRVEEMILNFEWDEALDMLNATLASSPDDVEALAARAMLLVIRGDITGAQADVDQALELAPENPIVQLALADVSVNMPEPDFNAARSALQSVITTNETRNNPVVRETIWRLADISFRQNNLDRFLEWANRARTANVQGQQAYRSFGENLYYARQYEAAIPYLQAWDASQLDDEYVLQLLAGAYLQTNQVDEALALYRAYPPTAFEDPSLFADAAYVAYRAGDFEQAMTWVENNQALSEVAHKATYVSALVTWEADNDAEQAIALLDSLVDVDFNDFPYLNPDFGHSLQVDRARIFEATEDYDAAVDAYTLAIQDAEWWAALWENRARVFLQMDELDAAKEDFLRAFDLVASDQYYSLDDRNRLRQQIVNITWGDDAVDVSLEPTPPIEQPDLSLLLSGLSPIQDEVDTILIESRFQAVDNAFYRVNQILADDPDNIEALAARVSLYLFMGDAEAAQADADRAIQLDSDNILGYIALAETLSHWSIDDNVGALAAIQQAYERAPDNPEVVWRLATLQWQTGSDEDVLPLFREAATLNAHGYRYHNAAGRFWYSRSGFDPNSLEFALSSLRIACTNPPDLSVCLDFMGALILTQQTDQALDFAYRLASAIDTINPNNYSSIAYVAYRAENYQQSMAWAQVAVAFNPENLAAQYILGLLAWYAEGDVERAREYLMPLQDEPIYDEYLHPEFGHDLLLDLAEILSDAEQYDEAIEIYTNAIAEENWRADLYEARAEVFLANDDIASARQDFRAAMERTDDDAQRQRLLDRITSLGDEE